MNHLPSFEASTQFEVVNFEYETGSPTQDTYNFAKNLGKHMHAYFKAKPLQEGDKISFVMHSQGGLVGLIWMFKAFAEADPEYYPQYAKYLTSFITLGTPYWGAKIATFASGLGKGGAPLMRALHFGDVELKEMNFGSGTIHRFRQHAIAPEFQAKISKIRSQVRTLNVGGAFSSFKFLNAFASGASEYEDDTAVPIPSSRFDFINETRDVSFAPFLILDAIHLSPRPEKISSLTQIPKDCIKNIDCNNPSFKLVLDHILNIPIQDKTLQDSEKILKKMTAFLLDINIKVSADNKLQPSEIKITFKKDPTVKIGNPLELFSRGGIRLTNEKNIFRYYYFGTALNKYIDPEVRTDHIPYKDSVLKMEVSAPGFKPKTVTIKVRPTYSTYIDVSLEKLN